MQECIVLSLKASPFLNTIYKYLKGGMHLKTRPKIMSYIYIYYIILNTAKIFTHEKLMH